MARIPDEQIERLKQEVSLLRLVESQGYEPKKQGKDYVQPDLDTPDGIRDRTILELFYASGIRRMELLQLRVQDVDTKHLVLYVRQGKGARDRLLPLSEEAGQWLEKYLHDIRPQLVLTASEERLFLSDYSEPYTGGVLGRMIKKRLA